MNAPTPRRARRSPAEWSALVEESSKTHLSTQRFCADAGISTSSLYTWRKKLQTATKRVGFTAVTVKVREPGAQEPNHERAASVSEPCTIEIALRNGRIVRVSGGVVNALTLRAVIAAAEERTPC